MGLPPLGWLLVPSTNMTYPVGGSANPARFQHLKWRALGGIFPTLFGVQFDLWFPEGHPPPLSRPTRGPQSSVQRMTSWVTPTTTPTMTMGAGSWCIFHPQVQSLNVTFEHFFSL